MKIGIPALPSTVESLLAGKPHRNASAHPQLTQDGTFSKVTARKPRRCRQAQNWLRFSPGYEKGGAGIKPRRCLREGERRQQASPPS